MGLAKETVGSGGIMRSLILALVISVSSLAVAAPLPTKLPQRVDPRQSSFWKRSGGQPLIVGSAALDTIYTPDGTKKSRILGGSAVYAAVAAAKGSRPVIVAPVGQDFPSRYVRKLGQQGVDVSGLQRGNGLTFAWTGRYINSKDRVTVDTQLGVLGDFRPQLPAGNKSKYVFLANMAPEQQLQVLQQLDERKQQPHVIVDTMNLWIQQRPRVLRQVMRRADLLLLNDEEAPMLAGTPDLKTAARRILAMGPKMVLIKQGKNGATLFYREGGAMRSFAVPVVYPVKVVDTTGAGDSFGGALLSYVSRVDGFRPRDIGLGMLYASAVASATVESFSLYKLNRIDRAEIARRFDHLARQVDLSGLMR
jgi:cytidine kinase